MKCMDREAFITAAHNTDRFASEGLPVQMFWEASIPRGVYEGWWLDPKDEKAFGPNAKNYVFDLAEAKKMIEAAGHKSPLEFDMVYGAPGPFQLPGRLLHACRHLPRHDREQRRLQDEPQADQLPDGMEHR